MRSFNRTFLVAAAIAALGSSAVVNAGPLNTVGRFLGVGWSEGNHARNDCPNPVHPSRSWYSKVGAWLGVASSMHGGGPTEVAAPQEHAPSYAPVSPEEPRYPSQPYAPTPLSPGMDAPQMSPPVRSPSIVPPNRYLEDKPRLEAPSIVKPKVNPDDDAEELPPANEGGKPRQIAPEDRSPSDLPESTPDRKAPPRYPLETQQPKNHLRAWYPNPPRPARPR